MLANIEVVVFSRGCSVDVPEYVVNTWIGQYYPPSFLIILMVESDGVLRKYSD